MKQLETTPRTGQQAVNICVVVDYQQGGDILIDEAFTLVSQDHLHAVAHELRRMADLLEAGEECHQ